MSAAIVHLQKVQVYLSKCKADYRMHVILGAVALRLYSFIPRRSEAPLCHVCTNQSQ